MKEDRNIAGRVLGEARDTVMSKRGTQHGDAENSFTMIAALWNVYVMHTTFRRTGVAVDAGITAFDVAEMMSLLKKARKTYGDGVNVDHYVDDAGYTALGAMIMGAQFPSDADTIVTEAVARGLGPEEGFDVNGN